MMQISLDDGTTILAPRLTICGYCLHKMDKTANKYCCTGCTRTYEEV